MQTVAHMQKLKLTLTEEPSTLCGCQAVLAEIEDELRNEKETEAPLLP